MSISIDPIIEVPIRGRLAGYTLRVYDLLGRVAPVAHVEATGGTIQFGKRSRDYGQVVRKSYAEIGLKHVPLRIKKAFEGPFAEPRFPVRIEGPDLNWPGIVKQGRRTRPLDPSQEPDEMVITAYDGLKRLERQGRRLVLGGDVEEDCVVPWLAKILEDVQKVPLDTLGVQVSASLRWSGEMTTRKGVTYEGPYDQAPHVPAGLLEEKETRMEQLVAILNAFGAVCYMSARGVIEVVPREQLGQGGTAIDVPASEEAWTYGDDTQELVYTSIPARTLEVDRPRAEDSDEWETTSKGGVVKFEFEDDYNLLLDPGFRDTKSLPVPQDGESFYEYNSPLYWENVNGDYSCVAAYEPYAPGNGIMLGIAGWWPNRSSGSPRVGSNEFANGQEGYFTGHVERTVMRLEKKSPYTLARLTWKTWDPGIGSGAPTLTVTMEHGVESEQTNIASFDPEELFLSLDDTSGAAGLNVTLEGDSVFVYDLQLQLFNPNQSTRLTTLTIGDRALEPVEMEIPFWPRGGYERIRFESGPFPGTRRAPILDWTWRSETYHHPLTLAAARRLAQQPLGTETIETRVEGVVGPGTRLTWPDGEATFPVGRKVDLVAGRTEITDITIPSDL